MIEGKKPAYPIFLDLDKRRVVVVGAGAVAKRKVNSLLECGARVRLIAPVADQVLRELAQEGRIEWLERGFQSGDLAGSCLVVCACGVPAVNELVRAEAKELNCLINVVDEPQTGNFTVPATLKRGPLQIAVSTSGAAPALARDIKEDLGNAYDESWAVYVSLLGKLRSLTLERVADENARRVLLESFAQGDLRQRIACGEVLDAEQEFAHYTDTLQTSHKSPNNEREC